MPAAPGPSVSLLTMTTSACGLPRKSRRCRDSFSGVLDAVISCLLRLAWGGYRWGLVDLFDGRAFPFRLDHLWPGEVHAQDHKPLTVRGAGEPVRFFLCPGRFGLKV